MVVTYNDGEDALQRPYQLQASKHNRVATNKHHLHAARKPLKADNPPAIPNDLPTMGTHEGIVYSKSTKSSSRYHPLPDLGHGKTSVELDDLITPCQNRDGLGYLLSGGKIGDDKALLFLRGQNYSSDVDDASKLQICTSTHPMLHRAALTDLTSVESSNGGTDNTWNGDWQRASAPSSTIGDNGTSNHQNSTQPSKQQQNCSSEGSVSGSFHSCSGQSNIVMSSNANSRSAPNSLSSSSVHKKTQYHKTKLCPWHRDGKCFMGNSCNYAHTRDQLKPKPDLSKTKLCPEIAKNKKCDRPACRFAHDFVELRATSTFFKTRLCKFWQRGYCPAGEDCRHAHGKEDLRQDPQTAYMPPGSICNASSAATSDDDGVCINYQKQVDSVRHPQEFVNDDKTRQSDEDGRWLDHFAPPPASALPSPSFLPTSASTPLAVTVAPSTDFESPEMNALLSHPIVAQCAELLATNPGLLTGLTTEDGQRVEGGSGKQSVAVLRQWISEEVERQWASRAASVQKAPDKSMQHAESNSSQLSIGPGFDESTFLPQSVLQSLKGLSPMGQQYRGKQFTPSSLELNWSKQQKEVSASPPSEELNNFLSAISPPDGLNALEAQTPTQALLKTLLWGSFAAPSPSSASPPNSADWNCSEIRPPPPPPPPDRTPSKIFAYEGQASTQ